VDSTHLPYILISVENSDIPPCVISPRDIELNKQACVQLFIIERVFTNLYPTQHRRIDIPGSEKTHANTEFPYVHT